jgi:hypothetical protein
MSEPTEEDLGEWEDPEEEEDPSEGAPKSRGSAPGFPAEHFDYGEYSLTAKCKPATCKKCRQEFASLRPAKACDHLLHCSSVGDDVKAEVSKHMASQAAAQKQQQQQKANKRRKGPPWKRPLPGAGSSSSRPLAETEEGPIRGPMEVYVGSSRPLPHQASLVSFLTR